MNTTVQHMEILGISYGATAAEVRSAWRAAVKNFHPDVAGKDTTQDMVRINAAYEALKGGAPGRPAQEEASPQDLLPFSILPRVYTISDEMLESWKERANLKYDEHGVDRPKPGLLNRLRRRTPEHKIRYPSNLTTFGDRVLIRFQGTFPKGKVDLYLPHMCVEDGNLRIRPEFEIYSFNSPHNQYRLTPVYVPEISEAVFQDHAIDVFVSTS